MTNIPGEEPVVPCGWRGCDSAKAKFYSCGRPVPLTSAQPSGPRALARLCPRVNLSALVWGGFTAHSSEPESKKRERASEAPTEMQELLKPIVHAMRTVCF